MSSDRLCSCGKFHESCASDMRLKWIAKATREDPRVIAARSVAAEALKLRDSGRTLPANEWSRLDRAWHKAADVADDTSVAVRTEKAAEYDSNRRVAPVR